MKPDDMDALLARHLAGEPLDPCEWEALHQTLTESSAPLDRAVDQVVVDRLLRHQAVDAGPQAFAGEVAARLNRAAGNDDLLRRNVVRSLSGGTRWWPRMAVAAAAAAALAVLAAWWLKPGSAHPAVAAVLSGSTSAVLADGTAPQLHEPLMAGHRIRLQSGFASIQFQQGAVVILEGEADLEITGPNRATLHQGSAVARVPEQAHGFTIDGPGGRVVDLGTEFAVRAGGGQMDVHVLDGSVEAHPVGQSMIPLATNDAVRLTSRGSEPSDASPLDFLTSLPPARSGEAPWLHWSFDEGTGSTAAATGKGYPVDSAVGVLTALPGASDLPQWTSGVRGSGVRLQGRDDYVQTQFAGISGSSPRTVACWVKVPRDMTAREGFALVSWGAHEQPGDTWQVSVNPTPEEGPPGRLRVGTHEGHVVGVTDLRDDQWHHVAVVLFEGHPANTATHVLLYVDGHLEPAACKTVRRIDTDTSSVEAQRVAFGKNSAIRSAFDQRNIAHTFRGSLDEITLCGAALSESEIRQLMETGRVAEP
jgi:ferric-dicitrate binding protein FerR (iron transport regulator)